MGLRIQPEEIDLPDDNPFANDLLGRQEPIEALTNVVTAIEGPCVLAVDASWGMGKTTFLRMWSKKLQLDGFPVIEFNAWETDFSGDPLFALASEITSASRNIPTGTGQAERVLDTLGALVRALPEPMFRIGLSAIPGVGQPLLREIELADDHTYAERAAKSYGDVKRAIADLRGELTKFAETVSIRHSGRPIVIMIDELDRCRPTYAIELLETTKHLFSVDHIVFVLCLDKMQLAHAVKAVYGTDFGAEGYLRRFFDIDYQLPHPNRKTFIENTLDRTVASIRDSNTAMSSHLHQFMADGVLPMVFDRPTLSQRQILQTARRLAVILSSLHRPQPVRADVISVLLLLRTIEPALYRRYVNGLCADHEVLSAFSVDLELLDYQQLRARAMIESILLGGLAVFTAGARGSADQTKLKTLIRYISLSSEPPLSEIVSDQEKEHVERVVRQVGSLIGPQFRSDPINLTRVTDAGGFRLAVRQLELFPENVRGTGLAPKAEEARIEPPTGG